MDTLTEDEFLERGRSAEDEGRECIALFKDTDGNWRGALIKGKNKVFVRDVGPETVLQLLLTHPDK